jgi:hypothetical protein
MVFSAALAIPDVGESVAENAFADLHFEQENV